MDTGIPAALIADLPKLDGPKAKHTSSIITARQLSTRKAFAGPDEADFDRYQDPAVIKKKLEQMNAYLTSAPATEIPKEPPKSPRPVSRSSDRTIKSEIKKSLASVRSAEPEAQEKQAPKSRVGRKELIALRNTYRDLLKEIQDKFNAEQEAAKSSLEGEMMALLAGISAEEQIYSSVMAEVVKQVTHGMVERGDLLAELRKHMSEMLDRVPRYTKGMYQNAMANLRLVKRLAGEVLHARDVVGDAASGLEKVKSFDEKLHAQTANALERMQDLVESMESHESTMNAYQKLYKMQRDRMENQIKRTERDRHRWLEMSASLAMRLAEGHNIEGIKDLHRIEDQRYRSAIHIISEIDTMNHTEQQSLTIQIDKIRQRLVKLNSDIVADDKKYYDQISKVVQDIKDTYDNMLPDVVQDGDLDLRNPLLSKTFEVDSRLMGQRLGDWLKGLTPAMNRFTTDASAEFTREIINIRAFVDHWVSGTRKYIQRCMETSSGEEYRTRLPELDSVDKEIYLWLKKLEHLITGEESVISSVVKVHTQLEDKITQLAMRVDDTFSAIEFNQLRNAIEKWRNELMLTLALYGKAIDKGQVQPSSQLEGFMAKIEFQINVDNQTRVEVNDKIHDKATAWIVEFVMGADGDEELKHLQDVHYQELRVESSIYVNTLLKDAGTSHEYRSHVGEDMTELFRLNSMSWATSAKQLILGNYNIAIKKKDPPPFPNYASTFPEQQDNGDIRISKEEEKALAMLERVIEDEFFKP